MMTLLKSQKFWDIVVEGLIILENISTLEEAQREELKVKEQKDASALYLIQQSLANTFFFKDYWSFNNKTCIWDMLYEEFFSYLKVHQLDSKNYEESWKTLK